MEKGNAESLTNFGHIINKLQRGKYVTQINTQNNVNGSVLIYPTKINSHGGILKKL